VNGRVCADCGVSIDDRGNAATLCAGCARARRNARNRVYGPGWYQRNKAAVRARDAERQRRKDYAKRARALGRDPSGDMTDTDFAAICDAYGGRCLMCGASDEPLTIDHIVPISRGGTHDAANIQPLCLRCNVHKGDRFVMDYRPLWVTHTP
jgi:5-methylcytosine-specific restriction endonuclease McrA